MIVLVCGGRGFTDKDILFAELDALVPHPTAIIEGGQRKRVKNRETGEYETVGGADYWANQWAHARKMPCRTYEARWHDLVTEPLVIRTGAGGKRYNAAAGPIRNSRMLREERIDLVLALLGGSGTEDCIRQSIEAGVEVRRVGW